MEYLMVVGLAVAMLLPLLVIYYYTSANINAEVITSQADKVFNKITDSADEVYFQGYPAKKTFNAYFPEHIQDINVAGDSIIVQFDAAAGIHHSEYISYANLTGNLSRVEGVHVIRVFVNEDNTISVTDQDD